MHMPDLDSAVKAELRQLDDEFFGRYPRRSCYLRHHGAGRYLVTRRIARGVYLRLRYVSAYPLNLDCFTNAGALALWRQCARAKGHL